MPLSRRAFVRSLGLGSAGVLAAPLFAGRGLEAGMAYPVRAWPGLAPPPALLRLDSNENPNGPGREALAALQAMLVDASRYPFEPADELALGIASAHGAQPANVLLGCGSTELLRVAVDAFVGPGAAMVTAAPSFENPATYSLAKGFPVVAPPVDSSLRLDLQAMLDKSVGAGLVYVCNPNNPTGTVYGASVVRDFVSQVLARSPRTTVLIDEAYHEYVDDPTYATAIPLALTEPRVLVLRTFSKVHGMAGLRVGYAIARPETIRAMAPFQLQVNVNILGAAAAKASLGATAHIERERKLNREARVYTQAFFEKAGYTVCRSETNFVMVEIRRPIEEFKKACADRGVAIGRPFPPLLTHARISIGTMEEMKKAVEAFAHVLGL